MIQMYAEYLLPDNPVVEVSFLNLIPDTCCVLYERPLDTQLLQKRHAKKPQLRSRPIHIHNAYKTDTLLIDLSSSVSPDFIREKLTAAFPDTTPFMFMEETGDQVICQFEDSNIEILAKIALREYQVVSDYCYNFDLLKGDLKASIDQPTSVFTDSAKEKKEAFGSEVSIEVEAISLLGSVLGVCKLITIDLEKSIRELGGELRKVADGGYAVVCVEKAGVDVVGWDRLVRAFIRDFEVGRLKKKKVSIPINLRKEKARQFFFN